MFVRLPILQSAQTWGSSHLPEGPLRPLADVTLSLDPPSEKQGPQGPSPKALLTWCLMGTASVGPHRPDCFCYTVCGFSRCLISANWEQEVCA